MHASVENKSQKNISGNTIRPPLKIGAHDDEYEREANHVADKVMRMEDNSEKIRMEQKPGINMSVANHISPVQMVPDIMEKCEECEEEEKKVQKKSEPGEKENKTASPEFANKLSQSKGGGAALPGNISNELGSKMGANFSGVKIHTGENAVQMNKEIGAKAFTNGNDIYFNSNQYNPSSQSGKHLLAHELTHTVQQGAGVKPQIQCAADPQPYDESCTGGDLGYAHTGKTIYDSWKNSDVSKEELENKYVKPYIAAHGNRFYAYSQPPNPGLKPGGQNEAYDNWENPNFWDKCCSRIDSYDIKEISYPKNEVTKMDKEFGDFFNRSWVNYTKKGSSSFDLVVLVPSRDKMKEMDLNAPANTDPTDGNKYFQEVTFHCTYLGKNCELDLKMVTEYGMKGMYHHDYVRNWDQPPLPKKTPYDELFEKVTGTLPRYYGMQQNHTTVIGQEKGGLDWMGTKENFMSPSDIITLDQQWSEERAFEALVKHLYDIVHYDDRLAIYVKYYRSIEKGSKTKLDEMIPQFVADMEYYYLMARMAWLQTLVEVNKASSGEAAEFEAYTQGEEQFKKSKEEYDENLKSKKWKQKKYDRKLAEADSMRVKKGPESVKGWRQSIASDETNFFIAYANRVKEEAGAKQVYTEPAFTFDEAIFQEIKKKLK